MQTKGKITHGNRCGHNPQQPRFCDLARRGKGGHPPIIGLITSLLARCYGDRSLLASWQKLNPSGRRRRSEHREAMASLGQYMFTQWFQLETRRCATPGAYFLQVPEIKHLAGKIAQAPEWKGHKFSHGRIAAVFSGWAKAGYITSHQARKQKPTGEWEAAPAIRTFTKKFFMELGGQRLWNAVKKAGAHKLQKIQKYIDTQSITLREYLNPGPPVSPRKVNQLRQSHRKMDLSAFPFSKRRKPIDRNSPAYQSVYTQKLFELYTQYGEDRPPDYPGGPPRKRWSPEEIHDNAQRIADKAFR